MARHEAKRKRHIWPIILFAVLLIVGGGGAGFWIIPAGMVPLPTVERTCTVTGGGTLRLITADCGTLLYRGHIDLQAGQKVQAVTTGQVAWSVTPVKRA